MAVVVARITSIATTAFDSGMKCRPSKKQRTATVRLMPMQHTVSRGLGADLVWNRRPNAVHACRFRLGVIPRCGHYKDGPRGRNDREARTGSAYLALQTGPCGNRMPLRSDQQRRFSNAL